MAIRGKIYVYMIFLVMAFVTIGLVSFQNLKERKNLTILLVAKNQIINDLNNRYEELLEATKKSLMQAKEDKENLSLKVKDLENNNIILHTSYKQDKEKCENEKNKEVQNFKKMLQARDTEIINTNAKSNHLKLDKNVDTKKVTKLAKKNNLLEGGLESFIVTMDDNIDETSKNSNLQKITKNETNGIKSNVEERNVENKDEIKDTKIDKDIEVDGETVINLEENELAATTMNKDDDEKV